MEVLPEIGTLHRLARKPVSAPIASFRVALLADTASQILARTLQGVASFRGMGLELFEAEFDQIELQILNPQSELHEFKPETALVYFSSERLADRFGALAPNERATVSQRFLEQVRSLYGVLAGRGCEAIFCNLTDPGDGVFGQYGAKTAQSLSFQIGAINYELMRMAQSNPGFHVYNLASLQAQMGRAALSDPKLYCMSKIALTPDACRLAARDLVEMISARKGGGRKCVILDLDNTLWGGVIGDDGLDRIQIGMLGLGSAFSRLQGWLKQLKDRGIVLAVCSKNEDATAREPFLTHPEMKLRLDDIAVFVANWRDKATNIRSIKEIIDVDYSAMVFLDDNPVERALVRQSFPTMTVPELPEDPCEYLPYLQSLSLFETASYTELDAQRTQAYQVEAQRHTEREKFVNQEEFLASLEMKARMLPFAPFHYPRIAQLTQRSNQYNLRTVRYSDTEVESLANSSRHRTFSVELDDKFGKYGLISVIVLERQDAGYFVDTWLMSCRVLGRGVQLFVLNEIVEAARSEGVPTIIGEYLPTAKNMMVADHYKNLGFEPLDNSRWALDVASYKSKPTQIARQSS